MGTDLVGRDAEIAVVTGLLLRVAEGGTGSCVIEGGIGNDKTALWNAALEFAARHGYLVLRAHPVEAETAFSFAALADLLRPNLEEVREALPPPQRLALESALLIDKGGGGAPDPHAVSVAAMTTHLAAQTAAGHGTIAHHDGGAAKRLAAWTVTAAILPTNPLVALSVPRQPKRRRKPFLDAEVPLIIDAARASHNSERDVAIITLAIACSLRKDELRQLRWPEDVDLRKEVLYVRDSKTEAGVRPVPISRKAITLLDIYIKDWRPSQSVGPLFLTNHGDAFSYDGFGQVFRRVAKRLPPSIHFMAHRSRNTGLTAWRRAGVDIATIAKLAGHSDIAHTEHYLGDITPEEVARVPDAFSKFFGGRAG